MSKKTHAKRCGVISAEIKEKEKLLEKIDKEDSCEHPSEDNGARATREVCVKVEEEIEELKDEYSENVCKK